MARLPQLQELAIGCVDVMGCTQPDILRAVATALRNLTHMQFRICHDNECGDATEIPSALFLKAVAAEVTKLQILQVCTRLSVS